MTTTTTTIAAATQAGVTVETIRTWCRRNVIAAAKVAGRWVIDTASLAHRIAIGAIRTRKQATLMHDLTASYTYTENLGFGRDPETHTLTPKIRTTVRDGATITTIRNIHSLLADRIDAIADLGNRLHTIQVLKCSIVISDQGGEFANLNIHTRDGGKVRTAYAGTRDIPVDMVLDLAEQLRDQLAN